MLASGGLPTCQRVPDCIPNRAAPQNGAVTHTHTHLFAAVVNSSVRRAIHPHKLGLCVRRYPQWLRGIVIGWADTKPVRTQQKQLVKVERYSNVEWAECIYDPDHTPDHAYQLGLGPMKPLWLRRSRCAGLMEPPQASPSGSNSLQRRVSAGHGMSLNLVHG